MKHDSNSGVSEQSKASKHRMADADSLFKEKRWRGAMHMGGYAVECLLKAKRMRMFRCLELRELEEKLKRRKLLPANATIFTHHLGLLLNLTQALERLRGNDLLWGQFNLVNRWVPAWRYMAVLSNRGDADEFLAAVKTTSHWIETNI